MKTIDIIIHNNLEATRLDTLVSNFDSSCSRAKAARLINSNQIVVNNVKKKPGYKVKPGDIVQGKIPDSDPVTSVEPENIDMDIVFEDSHIIIIDKKPGTVVHPAPGNMSKTIVNALLYHAPEIINCGDDLFRPGIVHRLDKDTSGLMVIARTSQALHFLKREFKQRRVRKQYLALVTGELKKDSGSIRLPIGRHPKKRKMMAVNKESGKTAITDWRVKERYNHACLVEASLKTGRTHQIRVHFYAIDHPLIGDPVYQYKRFRKQNSAARQMLHSWQLEFSHPYTGRRISFKTGLPEDFINTMIMLKTS